jgi:tetratricopeptide (TPR) repeat protein
VVYGVRRKYLTVKLLKDIADYRFLPGRVMLLLAGMLMLGACASQQPANPTPPPLLNHGSEIQVTDVDVLELTPQMQEFLDRYILKYADMHTRMYLLMNAVTTNGVLGFDYDEALTLTSRESFENHTGNCIGFANMMIALARGAGLNAHYQEIFRRPEWSSREDTVLLIKHINVVLHSGGYTYVVDISGIKINPNMHRRIITDDHAKALYLNNIGAEALLDNDLSVAHAYLSKSIQSAPQRTDAWVNLGVVFGRNEQLDDAEMAFNRALEIDASEYAAMSNLYEVYLAQEDFESADVLQAKVERYRNNNPYYLLMLSNAALEEARFDESISLLKRAIRKKNNDHLLYFALAKTQYLSGKIAAAEGSLTRARELAPEDMMAYYDQPLDQLITAE